MAKKLLVADDSLTIQKVIKLALSGDGYEIQTVSDGTECLQQAALFRPDVVLIDIGLPGRSAFDIKKAANDDPDLAGTPFVLMSSAFEKVDEAKVALLRFDGRLTKPFDPSNLKEVLAQALKMSSGEALRGFAPPPAPSGGFSLAPSDRSRNIPAPPVGTMVGIRSGDNDDVTGEINLAEPTATGHDPLWNESPSTEDNDIRQLTESTVKMSGLDDLGGWNISEGSKTSLPSIPEIFPNDMGKPIDSLSLSDMEPTASTQTHGLDLELNEPSSFTGQILTTPQPSVPPAPSLRAPNMNLSSPPAAPSTAALEALVEKHVREQLEILVQGAVKTQLEQMARKALPEIAERVVKQEIRKLLEDLAQKE